MQHTDRISTLLSSGSNRGWGKISIGFVSAAITTNSESW